MHIAYISSMTDTDVDALLTLVLNLQQLLSDILQFHGDITTWNGSRHQSILHRLAEGMGSIRNPGPVFPHISLGFGIYRSNYSQRNWGFGKGNFGGICNLL